MAGNAVTRNAKDHGAGFEKLGVQLFELRALQGAAWGVVLGVEVENVLMTPEGGAGEALVAGGGEFEVGNSVHGQLEVVSQIAILASHQMAMGPW